MNKREVSATSLATDDLWSVSHKQHICSSFAAGMWWAEAAYPLITLIWALFIRLLPDPSHMYRNLFISANLPGKHVSFLTLCFTLLYNVLCVPTATLGDYISFSMLLYKSMTSACSNCFQTRRGLSFHSIFRFWAQASVALNPAKADNQERCMMSCSRSTKCKNLVTKFPGSRSSFCHFLCSVLPLLCLFFLCVCLR